MSGSWICEQDEEDHEQDKAIKNWLENNPQGRDVDFDYKFITRKGTARNTLVRASFSLDREISEHGTGTLADFVKGSDGRDLYSGDSVSPDVAIDAYLYFLGFEEELTEWIVKMLKLSANQSNWLSEKYQTDSEWSIQLKPFKG